MRTLQLYILTLTFLSLTSCLKDKKTEIRADGDTYSVQKSTRPVENSSITTISMAKAEKVKWACRDKYESGTDRIEGNYITGIEFKKSALANEEEAAKLITFDFDFSEVKYESKILRWNDQELNMKHLKVDLNKKDGGNTQLEMIEDEISTFSHLVTYEDIDFEYTVTCNKMSPINQEMGHSTISKKFFCEGFSSNNEEKVDIQEEIIVDSADENKEIELAKNDTYKVIFKSNLESIGIEFINLSSEHIFSLSSMSKRTNTFTHTYSSPNQKIEAQISCKGLN